MTTIFDVEKMAAKAALRDSDMLRRLRAILKPSCISNGNDPDRAGCPRQDEMREFYEWRAENES